MKYAYDLMESVKSYGIEKFYEAVREHVCVITEKSGLSFVETDAAITGVYQKYTLAYAIATKARDINVLVDLLFEDSHDPIGNWEVKHEKAIDELNVLDAIENLSRSVPAVSMDEFTLDADSLQVFPNSYGTDEEQRLAFQAVCDLFMMEMETQTGLFGLLDQMLAGDYSHYVGDDYFTAVVICNAPISQSFGHLSI